MSLAVISGINDMEGEDWIELLFVGTPVVALVCRQCVRVGLKPLLPVAGLVIGLLIELRR